MKIRSKATLTFRAMLARRYGFGASPNKPPLCHLWPQRHELYQRIVDLIAVLSESPNQQPGIFEPETGNEDLPF